MFTTLQSFGESLAAKFISLNNKFCQEIETLIDVRSNKPLYYSFVVCVNKYSGNSNAIYDLYAQI